MLCGVSSWLYQFCATVRLITSTYQPNREPKSPFCTTTLLSIEVGIEVGMLDGAASP